MSVWASWPVVGETERGRYTRHALTFVHSGWYPRRSKDRPAFVGLSVLPGFVWRPHLRKSRREQIDDWPYAPYLRLSIGSWDDTWGRPMIGSGGEVILTREGAQELCDDLNAWLRREVHQR